MEKVILFSGGYDSTYLLNKIMKEEKSVTIISIKSNLLGENKVKRETEARKRILDYLKAKYYNCKVTEIGAEINLDTAINSGLAQPLLWLPFMQMLVMDNADYQLNFSYICDDQATIHMDDFIKILELSRHFQFCDNRNISVYFPLRYYYKRDIISGLVNEDKFLFENATSCEGLEDKQFCGECVPCKCLRSTLIDLCCDNEVSTENKEYYKEFLKDKFNTDISCSEYKPITLTEESNEEKNSEDEKE